MTEQLQSQNDSISEIHRALFHPKNIAILGASGNPTKNTARPLQFLLKHGYKGKLFPINPAYKELFGVPAYPDLKSLPEPVDHIFAMVSGEKLFELLNDCAATGARVITIYSDGFGESGPAGLQRQNDLIQRAQKLGLRILGPNSIGFADIPNKCILSVNATFAADNLLPGSASLVSQSGSMMGSLLSRAGARGFGFAKSISVGNEADICVGEIVNFLVDDPDTRSIILFLETIRQAGLLSVALRRANEARKPVIVYKLGRSKQGSELSQSHTGALAGNDAAVDAFLKAHGALRVNMLDTLFEILPLAEAYNQIDPIDKKQPKVAVITTTGGGAATVVDTLSSQGLLAVTPPQEFLDHINQDLQLKLRASPIMDLTLSATPKQYQGLLEQLLEAPWCDAVLSVVGSSAQFHPHYAVEPLLQARKSKDKPLAVFLTPFAPESLSLLKQAGIAAFQTPEGCADALACFLTRKRAAPAILTTNKPVLDWPTQHPRSGLLNEYEALQIFEALNIPHPKTELLSDEDTIPSLDYPVVAKICSRDIPHKTELGGVVRGITDSASLMHHRQQILERIKQKQANAQIDGILVQTQADKLIELILGFHRDPLIGPIIMLGAGGISAELNPDISIRLAPTTLIEAKSMLEEVRAVQLVSGYRNLPKGDLNSLALCIVQFSQLATLRNPTVQEAEINPLFIQENGVMAVDGLIRVIDE